MALQTLTLKLDGVTAGDYPTWCRDPEPPALDFALRSISIQAEPLGDTVTAILDWSHSPPPVALAASECTSHLDRLPRLARLTSSEQARFDGVRSCTRPRDDGPRT